MKANISEAPVPHVFDVTRLPLDNAKHLKAAVVSALHMRDAVIQVLLGCSDFYRAIMTFLYEIYGGE
jgi:hypothetical protein